MVETVIESTRSALRDWTLERLFDAIDWTTIESGPLEGTEFVSRGHLAEAMTAVQVQELPAAAADTAEVTTPATVTVWARCPRCEINQPIAVSIEPQLVVERTSAELKLKAKAKARSHVCGQLPIEVGPAGQQDFDLGDIVGEADEDA